jgi:RimJ/RimL family protein N-acetyltransferase
VTYGETDATYEAELGYELNPRYWGQGYATEAAAAMVGFGFEHVGAHRVWAYCLAANERSALVMDRLGMKREGHLRENHRMGDRWWDSYLYAVLAEDWARRRTDGTPQEKTGGASL